MSERLVVISAGEASASKTRALANAALALKGEGELIDLWALSADGLLGRTADAEVAQAVERAAAAEILVLATPVYRATFTGALKGFFDRFQPDALNGTAVVLCATAAISEHFLSLDTGIRSLVASLSGWSVPTVVYATSVDYVDGEPASHVVATLTTALEEAERLSASLRQLR